jgi:hypothetical protein
MKRIVIILLLFYPCFCQANFPMASEISVSMNISRGVLKPGHQLVIDNKNHSISFNIQKEWVLHVAVVSPKPKYTLTIRFYIGATGDGFKYILGQGLYVSYNDGLEWSRMDFVPLSDGWYKVTIVDKPNLRIATSIPYGQENVDKLIALVSGNQNIKIRTLGKEPRTFKMFEFGSDDGKKPMHYIIAGEDIWETAGCWAADAIVRYLNNNPAVLAELTSHHILRVVTAISPYSMANSQDGFLDNNGDTVYGSATWADDNPPGEIKYIKDEVLGVKSPTSGPTNLTSRRLHWVLNLHSWMAQARTSGMQSINKSFRGIELYDDPDSTRFKWLNSFLASNNENIPGKYYNIAQAWYPGLPRDFFLEKYNFISSRLEVGTYKRGMPEFKATGEAIINNLKGKGSSYDWSKLYVPSQFASYPVKSGSDSRYLVDQNNKPFLITGDAAWSLFVGIANKDVETYLGNRRQKKFNTVVADLIEHYMSPNVPRNYYGALPFNKDLNGNDWSGMLWSSPDTIKGKPAFPDFETPNEDYFANCDSILIKAANKNMMVIVYPAYVGIGGGYEGWYREMLANGPDKCRKYGEYLGKRYRNFSNIIWSMQGDKNPDSSEIDEVNAIAEGIRTYDTTHLFTAHCIRQNSAMEWFSKESWLTLNNIYVNKITLSGHAYKEYNRKPVKPFFLIEADYEFTDLSAKPTTAFHCRNQAYSSILCGALGGQVFGITPIWSFDYWRTGNRNWAANPRQWNKNIDSEGSNNMTLVRALMESREWYKFVPDMDHSVITSGYGTINTSDYVAAARTSDGGTIMAYIPTGNPIVADMNKIAGGKAKCFWFNPRDGSNQLIGTYPSSGSVTFSPPDKNDWVLVLDNEERQFSPPGIIAER